jgi:predicted MPP superfamily phosphohydrolase
MIDFIGDIHGHASKLELLLRKLGYELKSGTYKHPERQVLFIGDYIDRGPQIRETLHLVRNMVENGCAIALMGNHEYNAIGFHTKDENGGHLRKHDIKNIVQHFETIKQFQNRQKEYNEYIEWFKTLPLFYETDHFSAVHACWDEQHIKHLREILPNQRINDTQISDASSENHPLFEIVEETLKGKEMKMPAGLSFFDKDGTERTEIRTKWWENPETSTYRQMSVLPLDQLPDAMVDISLLPNTGYYSENQKPVFFGHYWLNGSPSLQKANACCLDYSVAKAGLLVAYRFDNEQILKQEKFVFV